MLAVSLNASASSAKVVSQTEAWGHSVWGEAEAASDFMSVPLLDGVWTKSLTVRLLPGQEWGSCSGYQ